MLSSTFVTSEDPAARGYGRYANPTWEDFESALGTLEGGTAVTFASGMAAVSAVVEVALARRRTAGDTAPAVVVPTAAYNTTLALLDELAAADRLTVRRVDVTDAEAVTAALDGATLLWLESPTNPMLEVADVAACCAAATRHGATAVVDSTFATPLRQLPLTLGADVVVHSATKLLAGHSDVLLGAAVTADPDLAAALRRHRTLHGAVPGPWEVWLALRGLRTVHLRVDRAEASARELAERLRGHRAVERVRYPGWGTMVSVEVRGGAQAADRVVAAVSLWVPATSLGGVESTLERRRRHAAEPPVVPESLVRLSVGVEDVEDLWTDLRAALDDAAGSGRPAG